MVDHRVLALIDRRNIFPSLRLYGQAFTLVVQPLRRAENGLVSHYAVSYNRTDDGDDVLVPSVIPPDKEQGIVPVSRMWLSHWLDKGVFRRVQHLVGLSFKDL